MPYLELAASRRRLRAIASQTIKDYGYQIFVRRTI